MEADYINFLHTVFKTIKQHPEWIADTITAIQKGVEAKIQEQEEHRIHVETALVHVLTAKKKDKKIVQRGLDCVKSYTTDKIKV